VHSDAIQSSGRSEAQQPHMHVYIYDKLDYKLDSSFVSTSDEASK